jgi:hypothetical protein
MASAEEEKYDPSGLGLCGDCAHARWIRTDKGSAFLQCRLSFTDSRFAKYPQLPVLTCSGYERRPGLELLNSQL